jgi:hypothetical protein
MADKEHLLERDLAAIATEVARKLAYSFEEKDGFYISLPLLYSSGSSVVINVSRGRDKEFLVSDMGGGHQEAAKTGADNHYTRAANAVAERAGVKCNGKRIWDVVDFDQLVAAVTVIGNCSLEACSLAEQRNVDRRKVLVAQYFYTRLWTTVKHRDPLADVAKDVSIRGNSSSEWEFDIAVTTHGKKSLFEIVSPNAQAVAFATTKCSDVGRLAEAPKLFAVVESKKAMGNRLGWLLPVATVIESNEPDERLLQLMALQRKRQQTQLHIKH